jgi:NADH-quinone oxidoreductase subunit C
VSAFDAERLRSRFPDITPGSNNGDTEITVPAAAVKEVVRALKTEHGFDHLVFLTAIDRPGDGRLELVYRLFSYAARAAVVVRAFLAREAGRVATVSDVYRGADWHEREAAELFGIVFDGHPDPRRLITPDDLQGYPLRKDFAHPNLRRLPEVST